MPIHEVSQFHVFIRFHFIAPGMEMFRMWAS